MGRRMDRFNQRRQDHTEAKERNRGPKAGERERREARIVAKLREHGWPATPEVQSWVSARLGKPTKRITPADVATLLT